MGKIFKQYDNCVVSKHLKVLFEIVLNNSDSGGGGDGGGEGGVYVGKYNLKRTIKVQY